MITILYIFTDSTFKSVTGTKQQHADFKLSNGDRIEGSYNITNVIG